MKTDIDYIKRDMSHIKDKLDSFINSVDMKYAKKETEESVKRLSDDFNKINIKFAIITGGAIVTWFIIQMFLKHFKLL